MFAYKETNKEKEHVVEAHKTPEIMHSCIVDISELSSVVRKGLPEGLFCNDSVYFVSP